MPQLAGMLAATEILNRLCCHKPASRPLLPQLSQGTATEKQAKKAAWTLAGHVADGASQ